MEDPPQSKPLFDPDWDEHNALIQRAAREISQHLASLPDLPAWQPMPDDVMARLSSEALPLEGIGAEAAYEAFMKDVLPYPNGNLHPRFFGWVQGTGIPLASLADFLASSLNPHMAGFNQAPALVEKQVIQWLKEVMGFPPESSGVLESGGTMANILGLAVARQAKAGFDVRLEGLQSGHPPLIIYASQEAHGWVRKGAELLGLGSASVRSLPVDAAFRMDLSSLRNAVAEDRRAGLRPLCTVASAGTVNTGAIDPLKEIAAFCTEEDIWFHIDGAFGGLARLSPEHSHLVEGISLADSVAVDLHKWMYLPFEIACILVKNQAEHVKTFAMAPSYIASLDRGVIAGGLPFFDLGVDLTRSFKALKAWMCIKAFGMARFGSAIARNIEQARLLAALIEESPHLELMAPVPLNVVCFRFTQEGLGQENLDAVNTEILLRCQERGIAVPSSTVIKGAFALRACMVNHRTLDEDVRTLARACVEIGQEVTGQKSASL